MDITGCSHLFGGENEMIAQILLAYDKLNLTAKIGCADTVGARVISTLKFLFMMSVKSTVI